MLLCSVFHYYLSPSDLWKIMAWCSPNGFHPFYSFPILIHSGWINHIAFPTACWLQNKLWSIQLRLAGLAGASTQFFNLFCWYLPWCGLTSRKLDCFPEHDLNALLHMLSSLPSCAFMLLLFENLFRPDSSTMFFMSYFLGPSTYKVCLI